MKVADAKDRGPLTRQARQRELAEEVAAQRESLLQACWAHRLWRPGLMKTARGEALQVLAPGWLNRGAGPDFTEARLLIGGQEHWGDVEVHVDEREWFEHGHDRDPGYQRVVLHLVLHRGPQAARRPLEGGEVPVLVAQDYLSPQVRESMHDPEEMLRRFESLPGRCGLRAALSDPEAVNRVIAHASEERARAKAERVRPLLDQAGEEEALFQLIFRYLGYRPHAGLFETLARRYPLAVLLPLLDRPQEEARLEVLARWFGAAGFLAAERPGTPEEEARAEYRRLRELWEALGERPLEIAPVRGGSRPWNSPERRLVGLFHHLWVLGGPGWLKGWLAILRELDGLRDREELRTEAVKALERIFATPPWEPWRARVSFRGELLVRKARLIGAERVTMLMANAVLPLFLAVARRDGDTELEKILYRLYLVLPPEGPNQRTRFMEKRLAPLAPLRRTLRTHQGLLQIHQDFCLSFYEGCDRCGLPDLIAPGRASVPERGG